MASTEVGWQIAALILTTIGGILYTRGWLRLRQAQPTLARPERLCALWAGLVLITAAHLPPVYDLSGQLLLGRSILKILTVMVAPPLIWLAVPVHTLAWGLPGSLRRRFAGQVLRRSWTGVLLRTVSAPGVVWLLFISAFLLWHDPRFASWSMAQPWSRHLTLWALLLAALLFWWHVVGTGPRIHRVLPTWVFFAYLVSVDIPNMVSGVTIAFTGHPIYAYYIASHAALQNLFKLDVMNDQIIAGGLIWFSGSVVYFGSAVLIMRKMFKDNHGDAPQAFPNWDSDERMIAPGLEHRVLENRRRPIKFQQK